MKFIFEPVMKSYFSQKSIGRRLQRHTSGCCMPPPFHIRKRKLPR
jgi:hypothetical protein